jgi:hypothetical protein
VSLPPRACCSSQASFFLEPWPRPKGRRTPSRPIRALYVTGGGFHDFVAQEQIVPRGLAERLRIEWTIDHTAGKSTRC